MNQPTTEEIDAYFEKYIAPELKDPVKFQRFVLEAYGELAKVVMKNKRKRQKDIYYNFRRKANKINLLSLDKTRKV